MGDFSILAIRIKQLRSELGLSQRDFAKEVGCTAATLSSYENDAKSPSLEIVKNIAQKCNVSIDWLCGLSEQKNNKNTVENYDDIIKMLILIANNIDLELSEWQPFDKKMYDLRFSDTVINEFLNEWIKMKNIYDDGTIDIEVYNLWVEKTLRKYNAKISDANNFMNIPDADDNNSRPFN